MNEQTYLFLGLFIGGLLGWVLSFYRFSSSRSTGIAKEIEIKYAPKELLSEVQNQCGKLTQERDIAQATVLSLSKELASLEQINVQLEEKVKLKQSEIEDTQRRLTAEFENIAGRLLEEKSQKFSDQNQAQISRLLYPLKEKITEFQLGIERQYLDETKERASLKTEIENLHKLNSQLSKDAANLAGALKGDSKTQGDWGEFQLEMLLEKCGLQKDVHFFTQQSYRDENGKQKRPDFVIQLPEGKHLIIDSKVSLVAYEIFYNCSEEIRKRESLKSHVASVRSHIRDLSSKNYQSLSQLNSPDYILLFVPIEPALNVALMEDAQLFMEALERNIVLVTASTLMATMRTVAYIWKQEKQHLNVLEIANESGKLYDKFVGFVEDLRKVGDRLKSAQEAHDDAMNKLTDARRPGDTLIGKAEKIRTLGANATKQLTNEPRELTLGL